MTRPAADRVKVEWSGTGTGTMTLGSNVSGFQGFPAALNGHVVSYLIEHTTAAEFEAGIGVYTSSGNTLTRAYRTYPTPGGSAVSFSVGIKHVRLTVLSLDIVPNIATTDPTSADGLSAGYVAGQSRWLNTTDDTLWFCVDHSAGSPGAVWVQVQGGGAGGAVASVNGATGTVVLDATEIDVVGAASNITPAGDSIEEWLAAIDAEFGSIVLGSDAAPSQDVSDAASYVLPLASRLHNNVEVRSHQASVTFLIPENAPAGSKWLINPLHDGCTAALNGGGTLSPDPARLINGGVVVVEVRSTSGSPGVPEVLIRGDVIMPATDVGGTKTYDNDDAHQDFRLTTTSTQTFSATANYSAGFYVNLLRATSGSITIDGVDADYTISGPDAVTILKVGTALLAVGKAGVVILDAA